MSTDQFPGEEEMPQDPENEAPEGTQDDEVK